MLQKTFLKQLCWGLLGLLLPSYALSQDVPGSEDHPLISRYAGSYIYHYVYQEFDEYVLPIAPLEGGQTDAVLTDSILLEGKVTRIQYRVEDRSSLEVYRNYEDALLKAGFDKLFEKQGSTFQDVYRFVTAYYDKLSGSRAASSRNPSFSAGDGFRYLAAVKEQPEGNIYVSLYVTTRGSVTTIQQDVIEAAPMDTDMISIDADYLMDELERVGFVTLHGLLFETDSSEIMPASEPVLEEIAKLLGEYTGVDLFVVGHTDNTGRYEYNMSLSQRRAESVIRVLVDQYRISETRLFPVGIGPVAPVATNKTEEGRSMNRRVELVLQ